MRGDVVYADEQLVLGAGRHFFYIPTRALETGSYTYVVNQDRVLLASNKISIQ